MASNDIELFQSFCRKFFNRTVTEHFRDVTNDDPDTLSRAVPRQLIKRICLHKDKDPIVLTVGRLLIWWVEARGLFDEYIYGIPSTDFEITHTYYPQVKLHFREDKYEASTNSRRPARSEVSFRWREDDYSTANINSLATKVVADFANPPFFFKRGKKLFSYVDKTKGYFFNVTTDDEANAKKIIEQVIRIQDEVEPDWEHKLKYHEDKINYLLPGTVRVLGDTKAKPKKRPTATVKFAYAELFIPGLTKPIILVDRTGTKGAAIKIA
jgi:hypothetical protein